MGIFCLLMVDVIYFPVLQLLVSPFRCIECDAANISRCKNYYADELSNCFGENTTAHVDTSFVYSRVFINQEEFIPCFSAEHWYRYLIWSILALVVLFSIALRFIRVMRKLDRINFIAGNPFDARF